ncbi:dihydropteroate synthase [Geobacter sp. DSM 9736]|uniref:dihydropteroate synthase n=1 Tax=Geobacter sp. DSM 9736 TaxID=1277350 RepID=UPI0035123E72
MRLLSVRSLADAQRDLAALGIDPFSLRSFAPKMLYRVVKVDGVNLDDVALLRKELLALGGDVAVGRSGVEETGRTTAILMGSDKQMRKLCSFLSGFQLDFSTFANDLLRLLDNEANLQRHWHVGGKILEFSRRLCIMGILNLTPDSFSDGNRYRSVDEAVERALQMEEDGADIIDVGGESTRPFAPPVSELEELRRVLPVLEKLNGRLKVPVSIDTYKAAVAREAIAAGAAIVNDVSGFTFDRQMAETVAETDAGMVLMHTRGRPHEMQKDTRYKALVDEVIHDLRAAVGRAVTVGIDAQRIVLDPGIGFGKDVRGNLEILGRLSEFGVLGRPILIGTSRKGFIGKVLDRETTERAFGTAATVALAVADGASIFRVHDVREMRDVVDMAFAITRQMTPPH